MKNVIIIRVTSGIGKALVNLLLNHGCFATGRPEEKLPNKFSVQF